MPVDLPQYVDLRDIPALIASARAEALGRNAVDVTSRMLVGPERAGEAPSGSLATGRPSGAAFIPPIVAPYDPSLKLASPLVDGSPLRAATVIATLRGSLRSLLAIERTVLNVLTHLSGI